MARTASTMRKTACAWTAYAMTKYPDEIAYFKKYGTPSDRLIMISNRHKKLRRAHTPQEQFWTTFSLSLHTSKGQKLLAECIRQVEKFLAELQMKCLDLFKHVQQTVKHRRSDTQANLHILAEAVIFRAATENKPEVLFAFDSINAWIEAAYGKTLNYVSIRRGLELLAEAGILSIAEWGKRGARGTATKIRLHFLPERTETCFTPELDDWLLYKAHAMNAVYKREKVSKEDVYDAAIKHFTQLAESGEVERKAAEGMRKIRSGEISWGRKLFQGKPSEITESRTLTFEEMKARSFKPAMTPEQMIAADARRKESEEADRQCALRVARQKAHDRKINAAINAAPRKPIVITEQEPDDIDIMLDRFFRGLVPTVQEDGAFNR